MRVIQTRNDTIRLIFNPKTDGLCLSDFLIVRDGEDNFLGQIVEIYDDKFNQEENVANIRLVFRVLPDCQVVPYDNFTPSRECEIAKIKIEEIEKCINADKIPVPFGINSRTDKVVNLNLNFFNNNPIVFADKLDDANCAFQNLAQKLKQFKKVVVVDFTGRFDILNAKRIKAGIDFKMPLDFYSLDYIWKKGLNFASIEMQAKIEDIFIELKKFVNSTEEKYIPYPRFVKVIEQQFKATPAPELQMLLTKLKKFKLDELFARSKKEAEGVLRCIQKQDITIVDLSSLKLEWHKEFLQFVSRQAGEFDTYFLLRLNENNSNAEIIHDLYNKNQKLTVIPSVSYSFPKLPQVVEYAKNYILFKTLNPRRDFGFANFQIAALNSSSFLAFGEDTKDFMFVLNNYIFDEKDLNAVEDKKLYIDLNLELEEMTPVELEGSNFGLKNIHIQKRLGDEVDLNEALSLNENLNENSDENILENNYPSEENFELEELENNANLENEEIKDIPSGLEENELEEINQQSSPVENPEILEEISDDVNQSIPDIVSNHLDEAVNSSLGDNEIPEKTASVEDLIQESLKNDEIYIKEISKENKTANAEKPEEISSTENNPVDEIPLAEEDLDFFANPDDGSGNIESEINKTVEVETQQNQEEISSEIQNSNIIADKDNATSDENSNAEAELLKDIQTSVENEENEAQLVSELEKADENLTKLDNEAKEIEQQIANSIASESENIQNNGVDEIQPQEAPQENPQENAEEITENIIENEQFSDGSNILKDDIQTQINEDSSVQEEILENIEVDKEENVQVLAPNNDNGENIVSVDPENPENFNSPQNNSENTQINPIASEQSKALTGDSAQEQSKDKDKTTSNEAATEIKEPVIVVDEKPNLIIEDFSKDDVQTSSFEDIKNVENIDTQDEKSDEASLELIAKEAVEARFNEVISEENKKGTSKNNLKINEFVSIDLEQIKNNINTKEPNLPIFDNQEENQAQSDYDYSEGMKVSHEKYGTGTILKVVKYSNRCLLQIDFENSGKRLLDPNIANIKPM